MWCSGRLFGCSRACGRKWRPHPQTKLHKLCELILDDPPLDNIMTAIRHNSPITTPKNSTSNDQ